MKERTILILLALAAMLALSVGLSTAQGPHPTRPTGASGGQPQALVGNAFTYQGHLKKDGSPLNATCDMVFRLYDDATGGGMHGTITTTVSVESGLFTVLLDFGPYAFQGSARWLEVAVQCPGDAGFVTLTPRQALTAVPYALSLRPGAEIIEMVDSGPILTARNTNTSSVSGGLSGISDSTLGYGVYGHATAGSGATSGVYGESESAQGYGVYGVSDHVGVYGETSAAGGDGVFGYSKATSSETYGVYGRTDSTEGMGVFGRAAATSGFTYGVYGRADSPSGHGVHGVGERGVYGVTESTSGRGVVGYATATSGDARGVAGYSDSTGGTGVFGRAGATAGTTYGVYGRSDSPDGYGVYGFSSPELNGEGVHGEASRYAVVGVATATSGPAIGVSGRSESSNGIGVLGYAPATTGTTYGVMGQANSPQGLGVYGRNTATSGAGVYGEGPNAVIGISSTPGYAAIFGRNQATTGTGMGLYGRTDSPDGWAGYFLTTAGNGVYITTPAGKAGLNVVGGTKSAVVRTRNGGRLLYTEESAEVWFTDYGFGQLQNGVAVVPIDLLFAQTVNLEEPYHVFIQVYGGAQVYVSQRTPTYFEVRLWAGDPNVEFSYRIVAKRLGYEDTRLAPAPWADDDPNLYPERAPAER